MRLLTWRISRVCTDWIRLGSKNQGIKRERERETSNNIQNQLNLQKGIFANNNYGISIRLGISMKQTKHRTDRNFGFDIAQSKCRCTAPMQHVGGDCTFMRVQEEVARALSGSHQNAEGNASRMGSCDWDRRHQSPSRACFRFHANLQQTHLYYGNSRCDSSSSSKARPGSKWEASRAAIVHVGTWGSLARRGRLCAAQHPRANASSRGADADPSSFAHFQTTVRSEQTVFCPLYYFHSFRPATPIKTTFLSTLVARTVEP